MSRRAEPANATVLVIDDHDDVRLSVRFLLANHGYRVLEAADPQQGLAAISQQAPDLVLLDMNFCRDTTSGQEGLDCLRELARLAPGLPVVVMTAFGSIELAVQAMRLGAGDFVEKPWDNTRLLQVVRQQLHLRTVENENRRLRSLAAGAPETEALGESPVMRRLLERARRFAQADASVLITGENGTGKSLLARLLHGWSQRHQAPFVAVNMAAVPEGLFESELFGHRRGAFTDAREDRVGRFELADGGTLFLDEVGCIPPAQQPKLLRVLESGEFEALGSSSTQRCDVRVIAASNRDFGAAIVDGSFRQDLYFRLNTVELRMPALRERREDIILLARHFLAGHARKYAKPDLALSAAAERRLGSWPWPGNVRELAHVLERAALLSAGGVIEADDLLPDSPPAPPAVAALLPLEQAEERLLRATLAACDGRVLAAAAKLGLSKSAMYRRLEKHGIQTPRES